MTLVTQSDPYLSSQIQSIKSTANTQHVTLISTLFQVIVAAPVSFVAPLETQRPIE